MKKTKENLEWLNQNRFLKTSEYVLSKTISKTARLSCNHRGKSPLLFWVEFTYATRCERVYFSSVSEIENFIKCFIEPE